MQKNAVQQCHKDSTSNTQHRAVLEKLDSICMTGSTTAALDMGGLEGDPKCFPRHDEKVKKCNGPAGSHYKLQ